MNKKLLAVAVAGVLAAPTAALAQSSVTISGFFKMSVQQFKVSSPYTAANPALAATAVGATTRAVGNTSQALVHDDSSRIIFNVVEDLGGGLQAIAQLDWRVTPDTGADAASGNDHVGFRSKTWGRIFLGRQDLHYFGRESNLTARNDLQADSISLIAFVAGAGVAPGGIAIAGATRTPNVIHYTTPNWGGFSAILAYSTSGASAQDADLNTTARKGRAVNFAPTFEGKNFTIGYSYWNQKSDVGTGGVAAATADQKANRLFGSYRWGGFRIGLAWDDSEVKSSATGVKAADRRAWSLPIEYSWGPHWIGGHYTKARDDKTTPGIADGARMWAIGYNYSLSKRTSVGVTYAQIRNDVGATYTLFTSNGGLGGGAAHTSLAGEDPRMWSLTVRHAF